jgi:hypothetical protein
MKMVRVHNWLFAKSRVSLGAFTLLSVLITLITNLALSIRPYADDYSGLGRAANSCQSWLNFASVHGENSIGFKIIAGLVFCGVADGPIWVFQVMNLIRFLIVFMIFTLVWKIILESRTRLEITFFALGSILLINLVSTGGENQIRQYLGFNWVMQWIQHSLSFFVVVFLIALIVLVDLRAKNYAVVMIAFFFCATYSTLTLVYITPALLMFYRRFFKIHKKRNKEFYLGFTGVSLTSLVICLNVLNGSRGQRAFLSQSDPFSSERFLGLLALSLRENFIVYFWLVLISLLLGVVLTDHVSIKAKNNLRSLTLHFIWILTALFFIEYFTYYAPWHHTHFAFFLILISFILGSKLKRNREIPRYLVNFVAIALSTVLVISGLNSQNKITKYRVTWDEVYLQGVSVNAVKLRETSLKLGDRSEDPFWANYVVKIETKGAIWSSDFIFLPRQIAVIAGHANFPLIAYDYGIDLLTKHSSSGSRLQKWLI